MIGIKGELSQKGHPIVFFSKELSKAKRGYSTYDLELHTVV